MRLSIALILLFSLALRAEVLETFSDAGKFSVVGAAENGFALETVPEGGGVRLRRSGGMPDSMQFSLRWTGKAYPPVPEGDGICKLTLRSCEPQGFRAISLRMQDRNGEVFQFRPTGIRKNADGTVSCYWKVGDTGWSESWGNHADKKVDRPLGFFGFAVRFDPGMPETELTFLKLEFLRSDSAANAVELDVDTGNPLYFLEPGGEEKLRFVLCNRSAETQKLKVELLLEDFFGNLVSEKHDLEFSPGERKLLPLRSNLPLRGHWEVTARLTGPDGEAVKRTSFLYGEPAKATSMLPRGTFLFGINTHILSLKPADYLRSLNFLTASGAKLVRESVWWDRIQPQRDVWDFTLADRFVEDLQKRGLAYDWCLNPVPKWAAPPEVRDKGYWVYSRTPPEKGAYEKLAETLAKRYKGRVMFWEMWNEADLNHRFTIDSYLEMLKEGYRGIKKGDPDAWVTTTGFASLTHPRVTPGFQRDVLLRGAGFYDIHAYHEHGGFDSYTGIVDHLLLPMRRELGITAPWFANETAVTSAGGQERSQALTVFKKIMFAWARGSIAYVWYNLRNKGGDPMNAEHNYGLLHRDFHPKSGYAVFHAMATLYTGLAFDGELAAGNGASVFRFKNADRMVIGSWGEGGNIFVIRTDAKRAEQVDLMDNRREVPVRNGVTILQVGTIPSSLELFGGSRAELGGELVKSGSGGVVLPGRKGSLTLTVSNPWPEPLSAEFELFWPETVRDGKKSERVTLPPGETRELRWSFTPSPEFRNTGLGVKYRIGEFAGHLAIPLVSAIPLGMGSAEGRQPDFVLDKAEQVFNRYQADPASTDRLWKGPGDLSARIWLERGVKELRLNVEVTDDIHNQKETGGHAYNGDNLQIAFQFGGQSGSWEIGLSRRDDGKPEVWTWLCPSGFDPARTTAAIRLETERKGNVTRYDARIPFAAVGMTEEQPKSGFRFNLLVNDNDGEGRDGWMSVAPGMGRTKDPGQYPVVLFPATP